MNSFEYLYENIIMLPQILFAFEAKCILTRLTGRLVPTSRPQSVNLRCIPREYSAFQEGSTATHSKIAQDAYRVPRLR